MFCTHCGKQIDDDAKFCNYCGMSTADGIAPPVVESDPKPVTASMDQPVQQVKTRNNKVAIFIFGGVILLGVIFAALALLFLMMMDKKDAEERDAAIESVQNSYFEFLPEMTVGEIITEYYGEDYWACDSNGVVEFWGTNQKDNSGLALHFAFTEISGIVDVPYIKYHEENETAHDISKEEFEEYILELYADYSGQSTIVTTKVTTTKVTAATKATTTTTSKSENQPQKSERYFSYLLYLNILESELEKSDLVNEPIYWNYYLYDINHDGVYELITHMGESEADAEINISSVDEDFNLVDIGTIGGGHSWFTEKDGKLYRNLGHQGYQIVEEIKMIEDLGSWLLVTETVYEEDDLLDYKSYGTGIEGYDISDTEAIEKLIPEEYQENKPYVTTDIQRLTNQGVDNGEKVYLYLGGDFDSVMIIKYYEYSDDVDYEEYSYAEASEGILVYGGTDRLYPSLVIIPHRDSGAIGDIITCEIPESESSNNSSGSSSYSISPMKGQINCHGGTVAGFTTDYVVNGGSVGKVRSSLGDTWHVTAKNACYSYGITWYELWDSDDGDYYGWVDSNYIDFY